MNRKKFMLVGLIALLVAGVVSWKILDMVRHSTASAAVATTQVVVAAHDLNVGQKIAAPDLRLVAIPGTATLPNGAFHDISSVVGHGVIVPIEANEFVLSNKVAGDDAGAGLPSMIPAGMRAVSVKVNEVVSVAGFVGPGTHVDVIVTSTPANGSEPATTTVLQDVPVLAAGKKLQRDADGKPQDVPVMTLLVSPADAQLLTLASAEGKIQLALRNPTDLDRKVTATSHKQALYGAVAPAPSAKGAKGVKVVKLKEPAAAVYSVEIIRGDKREVTKFE
jgi:pilus assembly protein CpaB